MSACFCQLKGIWNFLKIVAYKTTGHKITSEYWSKKLFMSSIWNFSPFNLHMQNSSLLFLTHQLWILVANQIHVLKVERYKFKSRFRKKPSWFLYLAFHFFQVYKIVVEQYSNPCEFPDKNVTNSTSVPTSQKRNNESPNKRFEEQNNCLDFIIINIFFAHFAWHAKQHTDFFRVCVGQLNVTFYGIVQKHYWSTSK